MTKATKGWHNLPTHIETFVQPHVPSFTRDVRRLFAICVADEKTLRAHLAHTPFEYVSNLLIIEVADYSGRIYPQAPGQTWPFMDCGIIVPIAYKGRKGGYYLFEYEDQDYSIFAGRELWGYPKTFADVALTESSEQIIGSVRKSGKEIVRLTGHPMRKSTYRPDALGPILNLHTVPRADGPGVFSQRIILRDTSSGFKIKSEQLFEVSVLLDSVRLNPLKELGVSQVLGGGYQIADYTMDEECGWGRVIETLV